jgi:hypothetical protein
VDVVGASCGDVIRDLSGQVTTTLAGRSSDERFQGEIAQVDVKRYRAAQLLAGLPAFESEGERGLQGVGEFVRVVTVRSVDAESADLDDEPGDGHSSHPRVSASLS